MVAWLRCRARTIPARSPLHPCDVCALHSDFGTGAHCDADIGLGRCRRIVNTIAGHRDDSTFIAQTTHNPEFILRQQVGFDISDLQPPCHSLRRATIVAREHDNAYTMSSQRLERRRRALFDRISDRDHTARPTFDGDKQGGGSCCPHLLSTVGQSAKVDSLSLHQLHVAERNVAAADGPENALARHRLKVGRCCKRQAAFPRQGDDRGRTRMLARLFKGRSQPIRAMRIVTVMPGRMAAICLCVARSQPPRSTVRQLRPGCCLIYPEGVMHQPMHEVTRKAVSVRLKRIAGQVGGLLRMVEDDRYCVDILTQINAVRSALHKVEEQILRDHVSHCVADAFASGNPLEQRHKVDELVETIGRMTK